MAGVKRKRSEDAANLAWEKALVIGSKQISQWSAADIAFATQFVADASVDVLTPINADSQTRVVGALSLNTQAQWRQLSALVVEELAGYLQPATFGIRRIVLGEEFCDGHYCSAHGDEVYFGDTCRRGLAVYRDGAVQRGVGVYREGAVQRSVGEGELWDPQGSAVVGETVFVAHQDPARISVYPRGGGARLRSFGAWWDDSDEWHWPGGLAACGGRVYVADLGCLVVFTESGAVEARVDCDNADEPSGVDADADQVFVTRHGGVAVLRTDTLEWERCIGERRLQSPNDVSVNDGVLFVSDTTARCVVAFDLASGEQVAILGGFAGTPYGVAVRADGTLFVTVKDCKRGNWYLYGVNVR